MRMNIEQLGKVNTFLTSLGTSPVWAGGTAKINAEVTDDDGRRFQPVDGVAVVYDRTVHLGPWLNIILRAGAATEALAIATAGSERDILLLHTHDMARPLGRTSRNSLSFTDEPGRLLYAAQLDLGITSVREAAEEVSGGLLPHASIGFAITDGEWNGVSDNCGDPTCRQTGLELDTLIAQRIVLYELSLVPQGACIGTSAIAAANRNSPDLVAALGVSAPPDTQPILWEIPVSRIDAMLSSPEAKQIAYQ